MKKYYITSHEPNCCFGEYVATSKSAAIKFAKRLIERGNSMAVEVYHYSGNEIVTDYSA